MRKSTIERCWAYSKRVHPLLSMWKFERRCVASDNSWFWICKKKQATGVLILVDTVKFKAESCYHSGSMKITFIVEINSHPCNEYIIKKLQASRFVKCRQCHIGNVPDVTHFGQQIKNNLT